MKELHQAPVVVFVKHGKEVLHNTAQTDVEDFVGFGRHVKQFINFYDALSVPPTNKKGKHDI